MDNWSKRKTPQNSVVTPKNHTTEEEVEVEVDKKKINKDIYIEVFDFWNKQKIIVHKKINSKIKQKINTAVKDYGKENILKGITNYKEVLESDNHIFSHKWTLDDFLGRGLKKFIDEADPISNYLKKNFNKITKELRVIQPDKPKDISNDPDYYKCVCGIEGIYGSSIKECMCGKPIERKS